MENSDISGSLSANKLDILRRYYESNDLNLPVMDVLRHLHDGGYRDIKLIDVETGRSLIIMERQQQATTKNI